MRQLRSLIFLFGTLLLGACSHDATNELIPKPDKLEEQKEKASGVQLTFRPKVDMLFVVDNSPSMHSHQENLAYNVHHMVNGIYNNVLIDYHIGVLTTDMSNLSHQGRLQGLPRWIERSTNNGKEVLLERLQQGSSGSAREISFDPVTIALTSPLIDNEHKGFLRKEAYLALFFITDAYDQGGLSAQEFYQLLLQLKDGNSDKLIAYGAIVPSGERDCDRDGYRSPDKIMKFIKELVGGRYFSLCSDFGREMANVGEDLNRRTQVEIPLNDLPSRNHPIIVTYGDQVIPNHPNRGWILDTEKNALIFGTDISVEEKPGAELNVEYTPVKYAE